MEIVAVESSPRLTAKEKRDAIVAAGGAEYEALLAKERARRAKYRADHPDKVRASRKKYKKSFKSILCMRARKRGRGRGIEATITANDIAWPKKCPVLGIELDYSPRGQRKSNNPANPTLDRWDNSKGYVPGNVFVISARANTIKNNATWHELFAVMTYARGGPNAVRTRYPKSFRRYKVSP